MTKIKVISNPYKQEIKYETYKENTQEWDDMTSFRVQTEVSASPTFFGWVFGFNGKVQILAPESVKEQYRQMIAQADEGMQQKRKQRTGNLTLQSIRCQETAESFRKARSMYMPRAWSLKFIRLRIQPPQTIVVKFG